MPTDIFLPRFDNNKLDSNFDFILNYDAFAGAREFINAIFNSWDGFDEHFISEFQTTGFNSRLWELYLYATFKSLGFEVMRCTEGRPDFLIRKDNQEIFIEAVTTNPTIDKDDFIPNAFDKEGIDVFFLKLRSTLLKKLKKKYWELPWVAGKPFILAIAPFHSSEALNVTDFEVRKYLYGVTIDKKQDNGRLIIDETRIEIHEIGDKRLSNFFDIPLTSNISGILYSNTGTMGKFSRMAYQEGYGSDESLFVYSGSCHDSRSDSTGIGQFIVDIARGGSKDFTDEWRFGLSLFHNHKAINPIGYEILDQLTQVKYGNDDGLFTNHIFFHPYNAKNLRAVHTKKLDLPE